MSSPKNVKIKDIKKKVKQKNNQLKINHKKT